MPPREPHRRAPGHAPVPVSALAQLRHGLESLRGHLRRVATAGTEIVISVLMALAFFAVFMLGMSVLMPSGLTLGEVVLQGSSGGEASRHNLTAALLGLGNLGEQLHPAAAVLTVLNTQVMRKTADDIAWGSVSAKTALREGDAVQTTRDGTAMLTFGRGKQLQLEQNSLVIVRSSRRAAESASPAPSVHVMMGEVWGNVGGAGEERQTVHVTSPGSVTDVSPAAGGRAQFRILVDRDKRAVLSLYRGTADVVARGHTVRVGANESVTMDSLNGVGVPMALPMAPALVSPEAGATFRYRERSPRIEFVWEPVKDVDGYRLLVSRSPQFEGVVIDQRMTAPPLSNVSLKNGTYYWRVSAIRAGAESAPSPPRAMVIASEQRPPGLAVEFPAAPVSADRCIIRGTTDPGTRILVAGQNVRVDASGQFEQVVTLKRGFNVVVVEAIDRVGNTTYQSKVIEAKF